MRIENKNIEKLFFILALVFIIVSGIFIRVKLYFCNFSIWNDEAVLALNLVSNQTYLDMFKPLDYTQAAPPFFMVISKFLLDISGQINNIELRPLILRLFPLICGIVSLPVMAYCVHYIFKNKYITLISTLILAFNGFAINYVQEFKQYEVELLFSIILLLAFFKLNNKPILQGIIFALAPWFSFSSVFILIPAIFIKLKEDKTSFARFFAPISISLLFFTIYYINVSKINSASMVQYWRLNNGFLNAQNWFNLIKIRIYYLLPYFRDNIVFALIMGIIIFPYKNNKKAAFFIITPILLLIFASFLDKYPFIIRLLLFLLPYFAIILANYFKFLPDKKIITIIFSIILITISCLEIQKPIQKRDLKYSGSKDLFQILIDENADIQNNVLTYTILGKYYLQPYENKYMNSGVQYEFIEPMERFKNDLSKIDINKPYYLFAPYYLFDENKNNVHYKMIDTLNENKNFEIIEKHFDYREGTFLIKFKKKWEI